MGRRWPGWARSPDSFFEHKFRRLLPRLGYTKAMWAIARHLSVVIWKILHEGAHYVEKGLATTPQAAKRRIQRITRELRLLGYPVDIKPLRTEVAVP